MIIYAEKIARSKEGLEVLERFIRDAREHGVEVSINADQFIRETIRSGNIEVTKIPFQPEESAIPTELRSSLKSSKICDQISRKLEQSYTHLLSELEEVRDAESIKFILERYQTLDFSGTFIESCIQDSAVSFSGPRTISNLFNHALESYNYTLANILFCAAAFSENRIARDTKILAQQQQVQTLAIYASTETEFCSLIDKFQTTSKFFTTEEKTNKIECSFANLEDTVIEICAQYLRSKESPESLKRFETSCKNLAQILNTLPSGQYARFIELFTELKRLFFVIETSNVQFKIQSELRQELPRYVAPLEMFSDLLAYTGFHRSYRQKTDTSLTVHEKTSNVIANILDILKVVYTSSELLEIYQHSKTDATKESERHVALCRLLELQATGKILESSIDTIGSCMKALRSGIFNTLEECREFLESAETKKNAVTLRM